MGKVFSITSGLENMGALKSGGQGSVYKARRIGEIITAVKLLPTPIYSETSDDKHFIDFQNEVEKLKKVNRESNPHVVKIINSGLTESGNLPYIEMEYIEGPDMEDLLKLPNDPIFTIKEVIKVADQLSYALAHCHKVDVKHGDIKSNNVKFNVNTGNYILLDFGLAIMSEDQRRTSMRQAGAIEFMAPEQNEGLMFLQTDVYSFGIILFELLAGVVPFPLTDRGETARNKVMLAHMEKTVPDIVSGRRRMIPENWDDEKKEREIKVPQWLLNTVYKCLQKDAVNRFKNGIELHEYIVQHGTLAEIKNEGNNINSTILERENERLRTLLFQYRELARSRNSFQIEPHKILSFNDVLPGRQAVDPLLIPEVKRPAKKRAIAVIFIVILVLLGFGGFIYKFKNKLIAREQPALNAGVVDLPDAPQPLQFRVISPRAYFYNSPDEDTKRAAYMLPSDETLTALKENNEFVYIEYTNKQNKVSKGWLRKKDIVVPALFSNSPINSPTNIISTNNKIQNDLKKASALLANNRAADAILLYSMLAKLGVAEAMYQYGVLTLKGLNPNTDCIEAVEWINKAAGKNYKGAKTTLGFLYMFAENSEVMGANEYIPCNFKQDTEKGTRLLRQSLLEGDTTAGRILVQNGIDR